MQFHFFIDSVAGSDVARAWLSKDMRAAHLSKSFQIYYLLRPFLPIAIRQMLQRTRPVHVVDDWYRPEAFVQDLARSLRAQPESVPIIHPWPNRADFAFVLTHDVETSEGLRNIPKIAKIEEDLGFRSSWNIVPYKYDIDPGLIRDLKARSFEIGIHGLNHDGRLYASARTFARRVPAINAALREYDAVGFRSPMVHRNLSWLQMLDIQYDTSCFDVDPFQAMAGGVGSLWPFVAGKFVELPYTLPQDHTMMIVLGREDSHVWKEKLDYIVRQHGMALMLTHPDYLTSPARLDLYREFLTTVRDRGDYWHALPREVASWWRTRDQSVLEKDGQGVWNIRGPAQHWGSVATVEADDNELSLRRLSA